MKLTKAVMFRDKDGIIQTKRVEMHPLEEEATRADWAFGEVMGSLPKPPTKDEEHELLLELGAEHVKAKRLEAKAAHEAKKPELDALNSVCQSHHAKWNEHKGLCHEHGHDPDTFDGDATLKLKKK